MGKLFKNMKNALTVFVQVLAVSAAILVSGCAGPGGHQMAFSDKTALIGNSRQLDLSTSQAIRVTKQVLVRQGFTIDNVDVNSGLIKATRIFQDPTMAEQSYNIQASAYVFENGPDSSNLTLSASEQTILHREWTTWWHLLWILPIIPTGTEYQTVVTKEGNITDAAFYTDFFTAVTSSGVAVKAADKAAALKAAAEKAAAEKAAAEKLAAEKLAAEKAAAEKAAAEKAAAEKAAAEKAAAEKAAAEKAAAEKAAAEKAVAEKAAAEKAAAEKAAAEKAAADKTAAVVPATDSAVAAKK
jgi:flagellar biosynthesis GTPase FlhF